MSENTSLRSESTQFHVAEYGSLHGEIRELNTEARTLERQTLYATGAVWAWLAIYGKDVPSIAWYIPVLFSVGGGLRAVSLKRAVDNIADYIVKLDRLFAASPKLVGWETYRRQNKVSAGVMLSAQVLWWLFFGLTVLVPTVVLILELAVREG